MSTPEFVKGASDPRQWESGGQTIIPTYLGGNTNTQTTTTTTTVTPLTTYLTGIIPPTGTTPTAGTGFTYTHTNGTGIYVFSFSTAFAATPTILVTLLSGSNRAIRLTAQSTTGFTVQIFDLTPAAQDDTFNFLAITTK